MILAITVKLLYLLHFCCIAIIFVSGRGWSDSTSGRASALNTSNSGSIPSITYDPLITLRRNSSSEPVTIPENHWMWPQKSPPKKCLCRKHLPFPIFPLGFWATPSSAWDSRCLGVGDCMRTGCMQGPAHINFRASIQIHTPCQASLLQHHL